LLFAPALLFSSATATHAQILGPADPAHSTVPAFIRVVGSRQGTPDPSGVFTITVRDFLNNPIAGSLVRLEFQPNCTDTRICAAQANGVSIDCPNGAVEATTSSLPAGQVTLIIQGSADNHGPMPVQGWPGASSGCIRVFAGGIQIATATAVVYDVNGTSNLPGNPGVNGADYSFVWASIGAVGGGGPYRGRVDYSTDGFVNGADLSFFNIFFLNNASGENCLAHCP